jgi:hypothetical protein
MVKRLFLIALVGYVGVSGEGYSQKIEQNKGCVRILSTPPIRKGVQALPLIAQNGSKAVDLINASLAQYNKRVLEATRNCDVDHGQHKSKGTWERSVKVRMAGPRFVSYVARDFVFCGGAHPDNDTMALVYDLRTGALLDWTENLPAESAKFHPDSISDGTMVKYVQSASIAKMYFDKLHESSEEGCKDAISEKGLDYGFTLWPDAKAGALAIQPNLPHAIQGCGSVIYLSDEEMQRLGVSADIREAIKEAYRLAHKNK